MTLYYNIKFYLKRFLGFLRFKKQCPQCGGIGLYWTEVMARYNDDGVECPMCQGTGKVVYR